MITPNWQPTKKPVAIRQSKARLKALINKLTH